MTSNTLPVEDIPSAAQVIEAIEWREIRFDGPQCPRRMRLDDQGDVVVEMYHGGQWDRYDVDDLDLDALVKAAVLYDRQRLEEFKCLYCTEGFQYAPMDDSGKPTRPCDLCNGTGRLLRLREQQP